MSKGHSTPDATVSKERRKELKNEHKARVRAAEELVAEKYNAEFGHVVQPVEQGDQSGSPRPMLVIIGLGAALVTTLYFSGASVGTWIVIVVGFLIGLTLWAWFTMPSEQRADISAQSTYGNLSPNFVCPHCHAQGSVRTKHVNRKKGISGAKAMGAFFTGGYSMLATGLARKEGATQAHCSNCGSTWDF